MKKHTQITFLFLLIMVLPSCSEHAGTPGRSLKYEVLKEDVYDAPIKTQVALDILLDTGQDVTEVKVRTLLMILYEKTMIRSGFKYAEHPTNVYIYVYATEAKANSGMAQWVGMIAKSYDDYTGKIHISAKQLAAITAKPEIKFGRTEQERQHIWDEIIRAEDRATDEADAKYPLDNAETIKEDINKYGTMKVELQAKYLQQVAEANNLDESILDSIGTEGMLKGWAFPGE